MEAIREGNLDFLLHISEEELLRGGNMSKERIIASSKIKSFYPEDSLNDKEMQLIYHPNRFFSDDVDCREIILHFNNPPIPVYINSQGIKILQENKENVSGFLSYKLRIKLKP